MSVGKLSRYNQLIKLEAEVESLRKQLEEAQLGADRYQYIEEHATTHGGGHGFTIQCFVPVDHEDMGCGIDAALAQVKEQGNG